ncbi:MAG: DUF1571 domain-containing protein [Phycisphaerales bacterium]|nr:DUF1571 domain-containing protein [Phycisphaerales bacterium]
MTNQRRNMGRAGAATGLLIAAAWGLHCQDVRTAAGREEPVLTARIDGLASVPLPTIEPVASRPDHTSQSLAESDPVAFLMHCRDAWGKNTARDYQCLFLSQERIGDGLTPVQEVAARVRRQPFSVDMTWLKNPMAAKRAMYVEGKWTDARGQAMAWFKPAGALLELVAPRVQQPIHGPRAKAAARRSMDQFGFERTLGLIIKYTQLARDAGQLDLRYAGTGAIDDRPTYVFERYLPYNGHDESYPDALLRFHIDQAWLVPTACFSYADGKGEQLLGAYVMTAVRFDVGLGDADYDPHSASF